MTHETDRSQIEQDKFVGQMGIQGYELLRGKAETDVVGTVLPDQRGRGQPKGLPSCGLLVAKNHTSGSCLRNQSVLFVGYSTLDVPDRVATPHDHPLREQAALIGRTLAQLLADLKQGVPNLAQLISDSLGVTETE
jgi:hypothetical protein